MAFSLKGSPYLTVRLKDKTGEIESKVWDNAIEFDRQFKKGDIISIEGKAASYKNSIQISIVNIKKSAWEEVEPPIIYPLLKPMLTPCSMKSSATSGKSKTNICRNCLMLFSKMKKLPNFSKERPRLKDFIIFI